ncbi:immunity protein Imm33 domain-containing protein [Streptococcus oricebi]
MREDNYGGFLLSKNVMLGIPIAYTYRVEPSIPALNGWYIYSSRDDNEYVSNPENFEIVSAQTMFSIAPVMAEFFEAKFGTDLAWLYEEGVHIGFYDLIADKETTIPEIMGWD